MKIDELNDYLEDTFEMELLDEKKQTVAEVIEEYQKALIEKEISEDKEHVNQMIHELQKYKDRYCYYAVDYFSCIFGQGFVIVDEDNNYLGFIRTI